jgi:FKBP-type peptidyl-prolyl cis-trans isomerase FkpA
MKMQQLPTFLVLLLIGGLWACQSKPDSHTALQSAQVDLPIDEEALIARLSGDYIPEPQTRNEQDRNAMLDYAIQEMLPVEATRSGLYLWVQNPGTSEPSKWGQRISAHYTGQLLDGTVFDDSRERGRPMSFTVGNMIPGFNEAMMMLGKGGRAVVLIPSALAYGERNITDSKGQEVIPAHAVLRFDVERVEQ